jgi:hypothetical protein
MRDGVMVTCIVSLQEQHETHDDCHCSDLLDQEVRYQSCHLR